MPTAEHDQEGVVDQQAEQHLRVGEALVAHAADAEHADEQGERRDDRAGSAAAGV